MSLEILSKVEKQYKALIIQQHIVFSEYLERDVITDVYLPHNRVDNHLPLLLVNDGQDLRKMDFGSILDDLIANQVIEPLMVVAMHCATDRIMEYGTACQPDYRGRGAKAGLYNKFIFDELLRFIRKQYDIVSFKEKSFAGFSLGGLCAMDIVWNHPQEFVKTGVFSGSLWWRRKGYNDEGYDAENDRIMHLQVKRGFHNPWLKFFFECGALDETADRNKNGIIDSIDDALDMIEELKKLGFTDNDIKYLELADGRHNVETWAQAFPDFLAWGWGITK